MIKVIFIAFLSYFLLLPNAFSLEKNFVAKKYYFLDGKLKKFGAHYYFTINENTGNEQLLKINASIGTMFENGLYHLCFKNSYECSFKCEIEEIKFFELLPPVAKAKFYKPDPKIGIIGDESEKCK